MNVEGPPLKLKQHVGNFRKVHKKTYVKSGKIFAIEARKFLEPEKLLSALSKSDFAKQRAKSLKMTVL